MEKLFLVITLVCSMIMTATALGQSPKEVEDWFLNQNQSKHKLTKLHFYYHNSKTQKNPSAVKVAASPPAFANNSPFFGEVTITDNLLTVGPEISSKKVGYAQGLYATASLEEVSLFMGFTFVFSDGDRNGSTLSVVGRNAVGEKHRELSIVGGTGVFRLAEGVVTVQTYYFNFTVGVAVLEMDVVALHY